VLDAEHEVVTVRATANGPRPDVSAPELEEAGEDPSAALRTTHDIWVDGDEVEAGIYDRALLKAGNVVAGPAVITEMDSTTLVLPDHAATVHPSGSLLIRPVETQGN
jgi:N-methylhydantoinase A